MCRVIVTLVKTVIVLIMVSGSLCKFKWLEAPSIIFSRLNERSLFFESKYRRVEHD